MNKKNHASIEASEKLVKAGIMLKTDYVWYPESTIYNDVWIFSTYNQFKDECSENDPYIPAPCFTEVWRELPEQCDGEYLKMFEDQGKTFCGYGEYTSIGHINPTNALIELLIWLKGKEK